MYKINNLSYPLCEIEISMSSKEIFSYINTDVKSFAENIANNSISSFIRGKYGLHKIHGRLYKSASTLDDKFSTSQSCISYSQAFMFQCNNKVN